MPNWKEILEEVTKEGSTHDIIRRKYLKHLFDVTGRNVIIYYSGWLQKQDFYGGSITGLSLNDSDKTGFMAAIHKLDRSKGLDLLLHTPGGSISATESLVFYLREMFGNNIRAIVPQMAMSAGTMVACACKEIVMGKHSSLGPIDPQIGGLAAHGVKEEFDQAREDIAANPRSVPLWQPIIAKYSPTLIGECDKAIKWTNEIVAEWLRTGMFADDPEATEKANKVIQELADHSLTKSHDRHISIKRAREQGLVISSLEENAELQDAVLSVHHICIQTLSATPATKIIQNHEGIAYIDILRSVKR